MARKAIKGYPEKSYYDNTSFKGVHATLNPLNEGYFNQMINFDIDDTGQSVKPRRGFLTTTLQLKDKEDTVNLVKDSTLYFFDPDISKYIFIDFSTFKYISSDGVYSYSIDAYKASFTLGPNRQFNDVEKITNVDLDDIIRLFSPVSEEDWITLKDAITKLKFSKQPESLTASDLITRYIFKVQPVSETINYTFLECFYRESGSTFNDVTFESDTLVVTYSDTEDTMSIDQSQRNIASFKSIIPDPMQKIYETDPDDLPYNRFDFIYAQENLSGKYLINYAKDINVTLTPHYLLKPTDADHTWCYSYDIISTNPHADKNTVYHSPIFELSTNALYDAAEWYDRLKYFKTRYNSITDNYKSDYANFQLYDGLNTTEATGFNQSLTTLFNELSWKFDDKYLGSNYFKNAAVVYIVPVPYSDGKTFDKNVTFSELLQELDDAYGDFTYSLLDETINDINNMLNTDCSYTLDDLFSKLDELNLDFKRVGFYITPVASIVNDFEIDLNDITYKGLSLSNIKQYALTSPVMVFNKAPMNYSTFKEHVIQSTYTGLMLKPYRISQPVILDPEQTAFLYGSENHTSLIFEDLLVENKDTSSNEPLSKYYNICMDTSHVNFTDPEEQGYDSPKSFKGCFYCSVSTYSEGGGGSGGGGSESTTHYSYRAIPRLAYYSTSKAEFEQTTGTIGQASLVSFFPTHHISIKTNEDEDASDLTLFTVKNSLLQLELNNSLDHPIFNTLNSKHYFSTGVSIIMYLIKVPKWNYFLESSKKYDIYDRTYLVNTTNLIMSRSLIIGEQKPTYMTEYLTEEPNAIKSSTNFLVFNSELGVHLVTWYRNKVYVSEADTYYYFKSTGVYTVPETILKVIQFKNTLLVFTTQNLYSIYPYTDTEIQSNGLDEEGNEQFVQVEVIRFGILPVLYNLMVSTQYLDAIQVFNQMVLFYSADGQLYLIKPTATIDSDTKFSIQYFNKAANDILLNYDKYMQERIKVYNLPYTIIKTDVKIKVQVNINYIKIFYTYKNYMYILIYDVINNYYFVYDTCNFSDIQNILFIGTGDLYVSTQTVNNSERLVFTTYANHPISMNNNYDENIYLNFVDTPIQLELDTGTLNLNTHLKKRFRDLRIIYKNISASNLHYALDIFVDDILIDAYLENQIIVNSSEGQYVYDIGTIDKTEDILSDTAVLFNLSDFTSNKIITHYTSIPCLGKFFRVRFRFATKGSFKFLGYGLVFKEHQI